MSHYSFDYLCRWARISTRSLVINYSSSRIEDNFLECQSIILGPKVKTLPETITRNSWVNNSLVNFKKYPVTLDITQMVSADAFRLSPMLASQMIDKNITIQRKQGQKLLVPKQLVEPLNLRIKTI